MEEVEDYKLLVANGSKKLSKLVNDELDKGYVLHGGPVLSQSYNGIDDDGNPSLSLYMAQAVVLPLGDE